jgi:uncharacterized Zn-finger protein
MTDAALDPTTAHARLPKFRNDRAAPLVRVGAKEFNCIGVTPPDDHPHVYLNMGAAETLICPYCATRYRFDPHLGRGDADPPDCAHHEIGDDGL